MKVTDLESHYPESWFYDLRAQVTAHVRERSMDAFASGDRERDSLGTREEILARAARNRSLFLASIGGVEEFGSDPPCERTGVVEEPGLRIEKLVFQSRPGVYVTSLLYVPDARPQPAGAVLFLCGHHREAKQAPEYQRVCRHLAAAGLVVLAMDPLGQGERFSYHDAATGTQSVPPCCPDHDYAGVQCLLTGDSLARYFLHDAMRAIDLLEHRSEVAPDRIGVTGNSGGGTQTCLLMLGDTRIAAAAPGTFIMNRRTYFAAGGAQDAEQIWPGLSAHGCDHEDILLAMAPKPVCVLAVTGDFFPIEGTRETVGRCRRLWELMGAGDSLQLVEDEANHAYTPVLARGAAAFFSRHLNGKAVEVDSAGIGHLPPESLSCTANGQVRATWSDARFAFEDNADRLSAATAARARVPDADARTAARAWLVERVCARRSGTAFNPRFIREADHDPWHVRWALWWSQPGIFSHGALFAPTTGITDGVTVAVWNGGTRALGAHSGFLRAEAASCRGVLVVDTTGIGPLSPHSIEGNPADGFYGITHKTATDLIWLGDDLCAMRAWDVLRATEFARTLAPDGEPVRLYGAGSHAVYPLIAAFVADVDLPVALGAMPTPWAEIAGSRTYEAADVYSTVLRGVLQHLDVPDLVRWTAATCGPPDGSTTELSPQAVVRA